MVWIRILKPIIIIFKFISNHFQTFLKLFLGMQQKAPYFYWHKLKAGQG